MEIMGVIGVILGLYWDNGNYRMNLIVDANLFSL